MKITLKNVHAYLARHEKIMKAVYAEMDQQVKNLAFKDAKDAVRKRRKK